MSTATATAPTRLYLRRPHSAQRQIINEATRFNVVVLGRRAGKTVLGEDRAVHPALHGQPVGWFSPTYKLLAEVWRELGHVLAPVTRRANATEHRIELVSGGVIEFWSLDDADPARGRKYARVVIDEAAMVKNLADAWQMAIRPTLTDLQGDAWFLSTPRGLNFFHALYQLGQDPLEREWASWKMPTSVNPYIDPAEIEAARLGSPERVFAQEYLAEFLNDGAGVFRGIADACVEAPQSPVAGHQYVMGVDWGKYNDFTVLSVLDASTLKQVAIDRFNKIDYTFQTERLMTLAMQYKPGVLVVEKNSIGDPLIENLRRRGLNIWPFNTTNASKAEVIENLSLAIERGALGLLDEDVQRAELLAYDAERLPSGLLRYGAPEGMHDDTVMALALAWSAIAHASPGVKKLKFGSRA